MENEILRTALITGASAGIGLAFTRTFAQAGYDVVLVARRKEKLEEIAAEIKAEFGQMAYVISCDLSDPVAPQAIFDQLNEKGLHIDALVNNAGYAITQEFLEADWEEHAKFLQVLNVSLVHLTYLFARPMKDRQWGRIINVSSTAAFSPQLKGNLYGAAKSFVLDFSQAVDAELREHNVYCTALCPGFTYSEFHDVMGIKSLVNKIPRILWMDPQTVAQEGFDAVMQGKPVHITGRINQGLSQVLSHLPLSVKQFISQKVPAG